MAAAVLFGGLLGTGGALPLIAIQILWVNLATDGLAGYRPGCRPAGAGHHEAPAKAAK